MSKRTTKKNIMTSKTQNKTMKKNKPTEKILIKTLLDALTTIKLFHWKTNTYSHHMASDTLYEQLDADIDRFVEVYMGNNQGRRISNFQCKTTLSMKNAITLQDYLIHFSAFLKRLPLSTDLASIRDDMLAHVHQFIYLLSMQ